MKVGELFAGIGGFGLGLELAGHEVAFQVEIDPFCQRVLAKHWPGVPRAADVRGVGTGMVGGTTDDAASRGGESAIAPEYVDLLCGGFPCQDLSVAGKRAGLAGERSGLFWEFLRVARELRPRWLLLENVPGLLSSHRGRDFGAILQGLEDSGYQWAYRILDSQHFGVAQRRRRVFIVGHRGSPVPPSVLFEPTGRTGHPAARREAGARVAHALAAGAGGSKFGSGRDGQDDFVIAHTLKAEGHDASEDGTGRGVPMVVSGRNRGDDGRGYEREPHISALAALDTVKVDHVAFGSSVRRLTPTECERLQSFPDGWTCLCGAEPYSATICRCPDSPRYRALGNAVTVNVITWIGRRLREANA